MSDLLKSLMASPPETWAALISTSVASVSIAGNIWQARSWMKERQRLQERYSDNVEKVSTGLATVNSTLAALLELVRTLAYQSPSRTYPEK